MKRRYEENEDDSDPCPSLTLIFPKAFEFFKFLQFLMFDEKTTVYDITSKIGNKELNLTLYNNDQKEYLELKVLLIGESDINFYSIFSNLVKDGEYNILVGSCGSDNKEDLTKLFYVEEAVKGDRGDLNEDQVFTFSKDKLTTKKAHLDAVEVHYLKENRVFPKNICSTNFLNMTIIDKYFKGYLFDMETYDFFAVCENGEDSYGCVRFVTDYVLPLNASKSEVEKQKQFLCKQLVLDADKNSPHWKKLDKFAGELSIASLKKYFRLRMRVDFSFLFSLEHSGNVVVKDKVAFKPNNIRKYYEFYFREFLFRLKKAFEKHPEYEKKILPIIEDYFRVRSKAGLDTNTNILRKHAKSFGKFG